MPPTGTPYASSDWAAPPNKPGKKSFEKLKNYICQPNYLFSNFRSAVYFNTDYSDQDQLDALGIRPSAYSSYKKDKAYNLIPLPLTNYKKDMLVFECSSIYQHEEAFRSLVLSGFPYYCNNGTHACFPLYESNSLRMQFILRGKTPQESMMVAKHVSYFRNQDGTTFLGKQYFPVIFLRDDFNDVYSVFAGLPGKKEKYLPLYDTYGLKKIEKAESVVICGTLEDADAMQRYAEDNGDKKKAFVAFVCDPGKYDQVDFSPLKSKRVEFLISNHSGKAIEEERSRVRALYRYLKGIPQRPRIKEFFFRERIVQYPADILQNSNDYYNAYAHQKSRVIERHEYTEAEFLALFDPCRANRIDNVSPTKTDEVENEDSSSKKEPRKTRHPGRPQHRNLTAEKTILRPFIRRGCTTVLVGDPQIGKSRFAIALAAQVAGSKQEFLKDRLWTRCLPPRGEKNGHKVVYWVFDDVEKDDISLQRNFFARGLSKDQDKNLFIEPARFIKKRDCENLKEELKKYSSRGTPNKPVDFLIVDTLLSFARSPAKIFSAFEELVQLKDELPGLAILVLHHNSKEGNPYGGILATNMPRVIIEMKRDNSSVLDDLEVPITINVIKHSNEHAGIDIIPFEIKLDDDHFVVTNNSELPLEMVQKLVIHEYKHNRLESYSNTDIGRLLGVGRAKIEEKWREDGVEEKTQVFWESLKKRIKDEAKVLNEASSRKKTLTKNRSVEAPQASNKNGKKNS